MKVDQTEVTMGIPFRWVWKSADPVGVTRRLGSLLSSSPPVVLPMGFQKSHLAPTPPPWRKCGKPGKPPIWEGYHP